MILGQGLVGVDWLRHQDGMALPGFLPNQMSVFSAKSLEFQKFQRGLLRPTSYLFDHRGSSEVGDPSPGGDWTVGGSRLPPHLAGFRICRSTESFLMFTVSLF